MNKLIKKIKMYIGEILLLTGAFIAIHNVLNFSNNRSCGLSFGILDSECNNPVAYFYSGEIRFMVGLGLVLLLIGILIVKHRDKNNK